jgi:hypothetical protein
VLLLALGLLTGAVVGCTSAPAGAANDPIALTVHNPLAVARESEPVTCGVPLPKGFVRDADTLALLGPDGKPVPVQIQTTGTYKDGSPRWVLLDFQADVAPDDEAVYRLGLGARPKAPAPLTWKLAEGVAEIDTGAARFRIDTRRFRLFDSVTVGGGELDGEAGERPGVTLETDKGTVLAAHERPAAAAFEDAGPMRVVLCVRGSLGAPQGPHKLSPADYVCRMHFYAGKAAARVFFTLHNPGAHNHPGNIWDLGSGGSTFIEDLSLRLPVPEMTGCRVAGPVESNKLYQDSSGGPNWRSANHIDKDYKIPVSFRGYRAYQADKPVAEGHRIDGWLHVRGKSGGVAVGLREFWQNFPKALEYADHTVRVGLWPGEYAGVHELLGGEQKTHEMLFVFHGPTTDAAAVRRRLLALHSPMYPMPDPEAVLASHCFWPSAPLDRDTYGKLEQTCDIAVHPRGGNRTTQTQWEVIDEYGWRHFGDTFADNEGAPAKMRKDFPEHHPGGRPISHFVNEYEGIYSIMLHGLRRGDPKWMWMADVMARHHADICVNHTGVDAPAYSHGPFMHTTHSTAAYRSTHRTYPIEAKRYGLRYGGGGGPNAGHTYHICLAQHYYLTGDRVSRDAFLEVANWAADSPWFKRRMMGDKRGYGNFMITFVYAWQLTGDRKYYDRAMTLTGWIDEPFSGLGGTLYAKGAARFLQMKLDNGERDADYRTVRDVMMKFGDLYLTLPASRWQRFLEQRCFHAETLCLCYLYAPKDHPNREKYYARGTQILDEALGRFPGRYVATKSWNMCFSNTGAYLKSKQVHAAETAAPAPTQ